ncbi:MAG: 4'-phosphopantetheinyl transferase superfamily protein [Bacteroidales bacterium]|nr:4'-phosphopantetheinyl transferase superfamily protein [Bacteroidales bacterium]
MSEPILQIKSLSSFDMRTVEECLKWFPQNQVERIASFSNSSRKIETAATYSLLVEMLQSNGLLKELPSIEYAENGKPFLTNYPDLHFNLSHCRLYVAVAIHRSPVGVDIECRRKVTPALIRRVCSDDEQLSISLSKDPDMEFLRLWTRKEAYLKYTGTGIVEPLTDIPPQASGLRSPITGHKSQVTGHWPLVTGYTIKTHPLPEGDGWVSVCWKTEYAT